MVHCNRGVNSTIVLVEKGETWTLLYDKERVQFNDPFEVLGFLTNLRGQLIPFRVFDMLNDRCNLLEEDNMPVEVVDAGCFEV